MQTDFVEVDGERRAGYVSALILALGPGSSGDLLPPLALSPRYSSRSPQFCNMGKKTLPGFDNP